MPDETAPGENPAKDERERLAARDDYERQFKLVSAYGVRIAAGSSRAKASSSMRTLEVYDVTGPGGRQIPEGRYLRGLGAHLDQFSGSTQLFRRAGALRPSYGDIDNKPVIEIVRGRPSAEPGRPSRSSEVVGTFFDFVMSGVQEQDAEKVQVQETFGHPHLFASGRFIRKYTFTGVCRAAPVNHLADEDRLRTPQAVLMRHFYDNHLRATIQAERGQFTRVVVDGDAYEGWIVSYNQTRQAQNEHWTNWVMSMVAFNRYHVELESSAAGLLRGFRVRDREVSPFLEQEAAGELADAVGTLDLEVSRTPDKRDAGPDVVVAVEEPVTPQNAAAVRGTTVYVVPGGKEGEGDSSQVLTVTVDGTVRGVSLVFAASATPIGEDDTYGTTTRRGLDEVNGSVCPQDLFPVSLRIVSYAALFRSLPEGDGNKRFGTITFTIRPQNGKPATVRYRLTLNGKAQLEATRLEVSVRTAGDVVVSEEFIQDLVSRVGTNAQKKVLQAEAYTKDGKNGVFTSPNVINLVYRMTLELEGAPPPVDLLNAVTLQADTGDAARVTQISDLVTEAPSTVDKDVLTDVETGQASPMVEDPARGVVRFAQVVEVKRKHPHDLSDPIPEIDSKPAYLGTRHLAVDLAPVFKAPGVDLLKLNTIRVLADLYSPKPEGDFWDAAGSTRELTPERYGMRMRLLLKPGDAFLEDGKWAPMARYLSPQRGYSSGDLPPWDALQELEDQTLRAIENTMTVTLAVTKPFRYTVSLPPTAWEGRPSVYGEWDPWGLQRNYGRPLSPARVFTADTQGDLPVPVPIKWANHLGLTPGSTSSEPPQRLRRASPHARSYLIEVSLAPETILPSLLDAAKWQISASVTWNGSAVGVPPPSFKLTW